MLTAFWFSSQSLLEQIQHWLKREFHSICQCLFNLDHYLAGFCWFIFNAELPLGLNSDPPIIIEISFWCEFLFEICIKLASSSGSYKLQLDKWSIRASGSRNDFISETDIMNYENPLLTTWNMDHSHLASKVLFSPPNERCHSIFTMFRDVFLSHRLWILGYIKFLFCFVAIWAS